MANEQRYDIHHNNPLSLPSARRSQTIRNTKIVYQNLLKTLFDDKLPDFKKRDYEIRRFLIKDYLVGHSPSTQPIHIYREFPRTERNYPFLLISLPEFKERKAYLGWDDIHYGRVIEQDGVTVGEIIKTTLWQGRAAIDIAVYNSVDDRDMLADYVFDGFQTYFRSNYIWRHPDYRSYYVIHIGSDEIDIDLPDTPVEDTAGGSIFPIYTGKISPNFTVEHHYSRVSKDYIFGGNLQYEGGPVPPS
jgi:hypothetical protein